MILKTCLNLGGLMNESKVLQGIIDFQPLLEIQTYDNETILNGTYQINELVLGEPYFENFDVKITITPKYPQEIPQIYVFGKRFDKCEHRDSKGILCLETKHNLKAFLKKKPTLKEFL